MLRKHHIDRISINPQTMNQETLDLIGRRHTTEEVKKAFHMARKAGFIQYQYGFDRRSSWRDGQAYAADHG